ncbi:hypothetical protein SEA_SWITZERLAND_83 [Gordonia phage Switzerland]|nr:hypothetical protein SEA_SHAYRA_83 [Gordonia phage ShayRa]UOK18135.1 hypothetical protein SEA_SWITZERLAND_83 [Gordonia phage Switzerland]
MLNKTEAETKVSTERDAALELWTFMYAHGLEFIAVNELDSQLGHMAPEVAALIDQIPKNLIIWWGRVVHRHNLEQFLAEKGW